MEWKRRVLWIGIIAGVYIGIRYMLPVLFPFIAAWFLAAWLYPVTMKIEENLHMKKNLAGGLIMAAFFIVIVFLLWKGMETVLQQLKMAFSNYGIWEAKVHDWIDRCCCALEETMGILREDSHRIILANLRNMKEEALKSISPQTLFRATDYMKGVIVVVSSTVITFISAVLLLKDMEEIRRQLRSYKLYHKIRRIIRRLKESGITYLKAQILIMLMIAAMCATGFWILGSPYFLVLGIGIGLLDALPVIGTGLFLYPAAFWFLIQGKASVAVGCLVLEICTSCLRQFMEPKLIGKRLGVHPVVILFAVYVGLYVYGAAGVILGPLSMALIYGIGKECDI